MIIRPSSALRNEYNELSKYCKESGEAVYITKNGEGDLVVMSQAAFEERENEFLRKEALLYFREKVFEAERYNAEHPQTYTSNDVKEMVERTINELED